MTVELRTIQMGIMVVADNLDLAGVGVVLCCWIDVTGEGSSRLNELGVDSVLDSMSRCSASCFSCSVAVEDMVGKGNE